LSLGSYEGTADIMLVNLEDGSEYVLEDVDMGYVSFDDIPMGEYLMTITWEDGVLNTISMGIKISGKNSTTIEPNIDNDNSDEDDDDVGGGSVGTSFDEIDLNANEFEIVSVPLVATAEFASCDEVENEKNIEVSNNSTSCNLLALSDIDTLNNDQQACHVSCEDDDVEQVGELKKGVRLVCYKPEDNLPIQKRSVIINQDNKAVLKLKSVANK